MLGYLLLLSTTTKKKIHEKKQIVYNSTESQFAVCFLKNSKKLNPSMSILLGNKYGIQPHVQRNIKKNQLNQKKQKKKKKE